MLLKAFNTVLVRVGGGGFDSPSVGADRIISNITYFIASTVLDSHFHLIGTRRTLLS